MKSTKRLAVLSMFTVIALTIFAVENMIPVPVPIPGIKLGLANIVTLIVLRNYRAADAFAVLFARILLSALFSGQMMTLIYGLFCFLVMCAANRFLDGRFLPLTSILGALAHNAGQLTAAYLIVRSTGILAYLPFLTLSSVITGLFTGLCAHYAQRYLLPHIKKM